MSHLALARLYKFTTVYIYQIPIIYAKKQTKEKSIDLIAWINKCKIIYFSVKETNEKIDTKVQFCCL